MEIGTRIKFFEPKKGDTYHRKGKWKQGIILQKFPRFYLVLVEEKYKECFYENEVFLINENIESEWERNF